tara:strand:+ start:783 stop:1031 length:249 start_codon:yes stop_codon:yes gene_type:complete
MTIDIGRLYSVTNSERQLSNSRKLNKLKPQFHNNKEAELTAICSSLFLNLHRCLDKTTFIDNDCNILASMFDKCISGDELNL